MKNRTERVTIEAGRYLVRLRSEGNPDYAQYSPVSEPCEVFANSFREASQLCRRYITEWDLGGGNWPHAPVFDRSTGKQVAYVSYNGRVWAMDDSEITTEILALTP